MLYNIRDSRGRFTKRATKTAVRGCQVVAGRLYNYRGSVVRAGRVTSNGRRHVSFHKQLHGFVNDTELRFIDKDKVAEYLQLA